MTNQFHLYIDRILPPQYHHIARERAIAVNPANASPFEALAKTKQLWPAGYALRITFLNGTSEQRDRVIHHAREWTHYAYVTFEFDEHQTADIRISFTPGVSWSAVGTDALVTEYFQPFEPTMNLGWITPDLSEEDCAAVVLHEFGHAIGLQHEHQSPRSPIRWNRKAVKADLSGWPNYWTPEQIEQNVFRRYRRTSTQYTSFDPLSIMIYPIPKHWTLDGIEFAENKGLSEQDKHFIRQCYPQ
jgi:hypothetical protein